MPRLKRKITWLCHIKPLLKKIQSEVNSGNERSHEKNQIKVETGTSAIKPISRRKLPAKKRPSVEATPSRKSARLAHRLQLKQQESTELQKLEIKPTVDSEKNKSKERERARNLRGERKRFT